MDPWSGVSTMSLCPASTVVRMLVLQTVRLAAVTRPECACSERAQYLLCECTDSHEPVSSGSQRELQLVVRELRLVLLELQLVVLDRHVYERWGLQLGALSVCQHSTSVLASCSARAAMLWIRILNSLASL